MLIYPRTREALNLLHSPANNVMLLGGRRSGKSYLILEQMMAIGSICPGAQMLCVRSAMTHIISSLWNQTLPEVLKDYPKKFFDLNKSEHSVRLANGSAIYFAGLEDTERVEKHLGSEYCVLFFNECSTIFYEAVLLLKGSLAQKAKYTVDGVEKTLKNKVFYDMNPPSPRHWSHKLFIEKVDPKSGDSLKDPENYVWLRLNPTDRPDLPEDYIATLQNMPDREKRRYLLGEFVKPEGAIYEGFDITKHFFTKENMPKFEYFTIGIDHSGTRFAAVLIGWAGGTLYLLDEVSMYRETIQNFDREIQYRWKQYQYIGYGDPSQPTYNSQMFNVTAADNAVSPGINYVRQKIYENKLLMYIKDGKPNCPNLLSEMENYKYDEKGRVVKENDDHCDALRYGAYSHAAYGGSIITTIDRRL